jgi:hypothetical protein
VNNTSPLCLPAGLLADVVVGDLEPDDSLVKDFRSVAAATGGGIGGRCGGTGNVPLSDG